MRSRPKTVCISWLVASLVSPIRGAGKWGYAELTAADRNHITS